MGVDELNKEIYALQLKSAAMTYSEEFSFSISPIEGKGDNRDDSLREKSYKQAVAVDIKDNAQDYDWSNATGLGVNLGLHNVWGLDIDNIPTSADKREKLISDILYLLRLPQDYEWVVNTGGGKGIHVIFRSQLMEEAKMDNTVLSFSSEDTSMCVSLRMNAFLVLPPSTHYSGERYEFLKRKMPSNEPQFVSIDSLYSFFSRYYGMEDIPCLEDNGIYYYLRRNAILKECYTEGYGSDERYVYCFNDEVEFLRSCHNPEALNSLGCLYMKKAYDEPKNKLAYFELAKKCFKESGNEDASNNVRAIDAILESQQKQEYSSLKHFGHYGYVFLKKRKYKYLFFDTETTGLPKSFNASYKDFDNWPRLVQISWLCVSDRGEIISKSIYDIQPVGFSIPEESAMIHGVDNELAIEIGENLTEVLKEFGDCVAYADCIVGHNVDYDVNVVCAEIRRDIARYSRGKWEVDHHSFITREPWENEDWRYTSYDEIIADCARIDTMKSSVNLCCIPGYNGQYKYPKLQELYRYLFGKEFGNAHNSMADIRATLECFLELKKRGVIRDT